MIRSSFTAVLAIAATHALASTAVADTPEVAGDFSQEIEVRLAEIEVVVTDREGRPVLGLTEADFELTQDGQPVELTHFRVVDGRSPSAEPFVPPPSASAPSPSAAAGALVDDRRLYLVICVDRSYLEPGDLGDVREALKGFLRESLGPNDRVMLVTAADSLELRQGFTTVAELVVSELDAIHERPGGGRMAREYTSILRDIRRTKSEGTDLNARDARLPARSLLARVQAFAAEVQGEVRGTTSQLQQLIASIAGLPGRRAVLYVGGRVPVVYGRRLFEAWEESFGRNSNLQIADTPGGPELFGGDDTQAAADDPIMDSVSATSSSFEADASRRVEEVARAASSHGVVFHTLDASGLRGSASLFSAPGDATLGARGTSQGGSTTHPGSLADTLGSLRDLALGTGGLAITGSRDFSGALTRIGDALSVYYSLGFEPRETKDRHSRVEVRLRPGDGRKRLDVRHRPHLVLKDSDTLAVERTISALLLEELENPLGVEVAVGEPKAGPEGERKVPVSVTLPLARLALVADGQAHTGRLSIFAASGRLDRVSQVIKAVVPVRIPNRDLLTSLGRRLSYELELTWNGGLEKIAVTVRDDFRPRSSTAVAVTAGDGRGGPSP